MKRCYPKPHDSCGEINVTIDGREYSVEYYVEPADPEVGARGHIEITHSEIGFIVDITPYQLKKRQELESKMEDAVLKALEDQAESDYDEHKHEEYKERQLYRD